MELLYNNQFQIDKAIILAELVKRHHTVVLSTRSPDKQFILVGRKA